ncbi:MAG: hypothetical protein JNL83_02740 [Myxococcales bacterium]|nr:hypothetical protein [Myxococcales bacterium]
MKGGVAVLVGVGALALGACGDDAGGPVATFDVPASGAIAWGKAPFPSDVFLGPGGTVELASLPSDAPVWQPVLADLQQKRGFCGTCPVYFPIEGEIDPATLAGGVVMVDASGTPIEVDARWDAEGHVIAVQPLRGIVLDPGTRYTAALTTAVRSPDGAALRAGTSFTSARAKAVNDPALATLGDAGTDAVAIAAFTVEDPTLLAKELAAKVTAYVGAHGAPAVTVERVWRASDGSLDALMGKPAQDRPGNDVPSLAGEVGTTAIAHGSIAILVKGHFRSLRAITGTGTELGTLKAELSPGDDVPFLLAVPAGADVTKLPVLVFHHGLTGTLPNALALADAAAKAGVAFLTLETFQHGERSVGAVDSLHTIRTDPGTLGPDGLFEQTALTVASRSLAVLGPPPAEQGSPRYVLGTLAQMVTDLHALLATVERGNLAPIAGADASLAGLAFDPGKVYFMGLSLGTVIGHATLVGDTLVKAAIFNVPPSGLVSVLCENETFRTQVELLVLDALEIQNRTYEPDFPLAMHPLMGFYQWETHGLEPTAMVRAVVAKPGRDLLWQIAGLDELAGVPAGNHLVAVAKVPALGSYPHAKVVAGTAPLAGRGAAVFPQADHYMALTNAGSSKNVHPALPPFQARPTPLLFENPIASVQAQITHFLSSKRTTGTAEIQAP